jgi:hypothetical protein
LRERETLPQRPEKGDHAAHSHSQLILVVVVVGAAVVVLVVGMVVLVVEGGGRVAAVVVATQVLFRRSEDPVLAAVSTPQRIGWVKQSAPPLQTRVRVLDALQPLGASVHAVHAVQAHMHEGGLVRGAAVVGLVVGLAVVGAAVGLVVVLKTVDGACVVEGEGHCRNWDLDSTSFDGGPQRVG